RLGGLAAPLAPLERDEVAGHGPSPVGTGGSGSRDPGGMTLRSDGWSWLCFTDVIGRVRSDTRSSPDQRVPGGGPACSARTARKPAARMMSAASHRVSRTPGTATLTLRNETSRWTNR